MWQFLALAGGVIALDRLMSSEADHDEVLEDAVNNLQNQTPGDASVYADHTDLAPSPHGEIEGIDGHVPDIVVKSAIANNLIVEVETKSSLDNRAAEARSQLDEFSTRGYRRVLVVPEEDVDAVEEFMRDVNEQIDGAINTATPSTVTDLL